MVLCSVTQARVVSGFHEKLVMSETERAGVSLCSATHARSVSLTTAPFHSRYFCHKIFANFRTNKNIRGMSLPSGSSEGSETPALVALFALKHSGFALGA